MGKGAKKDRKRAPRPPVEPVVTVPRAVVVDAPPSAEPAEPVTPPEPVTPTEPMTLAELEGRAAKAAAKAEKPAKPGKAAKGAPPTNLAAYAHAAALTGAKKIKKKCCRSTPRCKGCPVVLMRAARLQESGYSGKDLKKAVKRARAA